MNINYLPPELLLKIFQNMRVKDIIECRNVCQRWKLVVDGLKDKFWKEICKRDHCDVYKEAYRKARLSWRELCRTLDLWSEIATADVRVQQIPDLCTSTINEFRIPGNGILACAEENTIAYYDILTMKKVRQENFNFKVIFYDVNDLILVVENIAEGLLHIIPKSNKESYIEILVKDKKVNEDGPCNQQWALNGKKVYYLAESNKLCCVELKEDNNHIVWEIVIAVDSSIIDDHGDTQHIESLESVVDINKIQTNILAYYGEDCLSIFSLTGDKLTEICSLGSTLDREELIHRHGFHWVHEYGLRVNNSLCVMPLETRCVYFYGNIAISIKMGSNYYYPSCSFDSNRPNVNDYNVLQIYYNPFREDWRLDLVTSEPVKSIILPKKGFYRFEKIDVLETRNGHKILISLSGELLLYELVHVGRGTD